MGTQEPRRFLHSTDGNILTQVVEDPSRRGVLLDLALTNKEGLAGGVKTGGNLDCSDRETMAFKILSGGSQQ